MKRFLHYPAMAVGVCTGVVILVALMAQACWHLAGAGHASLPGVQGPMVSQSRATEGKRTHSVGEWPAEKGREFHEAPMLQARVAAGQLPPVSQRLPEDPLVIYPPDQIGPYGGTWKRLATSRIDLNSVFGAITCERLVKWGPMNRRILPNLARRWHVDDDSRTFTFWLRKGVRWSDGHPFTADDVIFWYEDVLQCPDIIPIIPPLYKKGGEVVKVVKLDDYTVQFRFKEPHPLFLGTMAGALAGGEFIPVAYPAHYMKQFHPRYVPKEELEEQARAEGFQFWYELWGNRRHTVNPRMPRLTAWVMTEPPPARPAVFERNPYYWKVDPSGNQLPYIDRIALEIVGPEVLNLRAISGEVGMQGRHLDFVNYPLFMENRERGDYRVRLWIASVGTQNVLAPNLAHKDPVLRRILRDRRFRIALSVAINREDLNEVGFFGIGTPRQPSPPPISPFYAPEYARAFTEYDPALANRLLDEMGLDRRNSEGVRLRPDGKPLMLMIEMSSVYGANANVLQLVADDWTAVGVKTELKQTALLLYVYRQLALSYDVGAYGGGASLLPLLEPSCLFPGGGDSYQAYSYRHWFQSEGRSGQAPPQEIQACMELFRKIERTPDEDEQMRLYQRIIELNRRNLWMIGTVGDVPAIYLVKNDFRNVPEVAVQGFRAPGNTAPECYAIEPE